MKTMIKVVLAAILLTVSAAPALANIDQMKVYRSVHPDLKPSCLYCHVDKAPKKEAGQHELNPYGEWLKKLMDGNELTEEMVKAAGRHDEFKPEESAAETDVEGTQTQTTGTADAGATTEGTGETMPETAE